MNLSNQRDHINISQHISGGTLTSPLIEQRLKTFPNTLLIMYKHCTILLNKTSKHNFLIAKHMVKNKPYNQYTFVGSHHTSQHLHRHDLPLPEIGSSHLQTYVSLPGLSLAEAQVQTASLSPPAQKQGEGGKFSLLACKFS